MFKLESKPIPIYKVIVKYLIDEPYLDIEKTGFYKDTAEEVFYQNKWINKTKYVPKGHTTHEYESIIVQELVPKKITDTKIIDILKRKVTKCELFDYKYIINYTDFLEYLEKIFLPNCIHQLSSYMKMYNISYDIVLRNIEYDSCRYYHLCKNEELKNKIKEDKKWVPINYTKDKYISDIESIIRECFSIAQYVYQSNPNVFLEKFKKELKTELKFDSIVDESIVELKNK